MNQTHYLITYGEHGSETLDGLIIIDDMDWPMPRVCALAVVIWGPDCNVTNVQKVGRFEDPQAAPVIVNMNG